MPGRPKITKEIDQVLLDMKGTIQNIFSHAHKICLRADLWTKRGMTSSYLGITGHFLCRRGCKKHIVMLELCVLAHSHMAEHIKFTLDEVLNEWDIPPTKIMVVITDNGSNMVKVFRQTAVASDDREEENADEKEKDTSDKEEDTSDKEEDTSDKEEDTSDKEEDTSDKEEETSDKQEDTSVEEDVIKEEVLGEDFDFVQKELDMK